MSSIKVKDMWTVLIVGLFFYLLIPAPSFAKVFKKNTVLMGTDIELTASDTDEARVHSAFDAAIHEMERIENEMSEWREETPLSMINRKAGKEAVVVPEELFNVILAAQKVSELSDGAFDISWASMRGVWSFAKGKEHLPAPEEIRERLPLVNYKNIELDAAKKTVFLKRPGMAIGLGAIAQGYAVDKKQATRRKGCQSVTILAPDTMTSDALSTAVFVLGPENGMKLIKGLPGIEGIIVDRHGDVHYSPGISNKYK